MGKKKRLISLFCLLAMLSAVFMGCNGSKDASSRANEKGKQNENTGNMDKKLKLTIADLSEYDVEDPMYKILAKKFNVEVDPVEISWDTWEQQANTWIAGGDMPDALDYELKPEKMEILGEWADQGILKEIPSLDKYPNMKALYDQIPEAEHLKVNGKLYAWPKLRGDNPYNSIDSKSIAYRRDWAEKVGMAKENDEYTIDEFLELLKKFKDEDPGGQGTLPYSEVSYFFGYIANSQYDKLTKDVLNYEKKDGKFVWIPAQPEAVENVKFLNQMYRDGLFWKDFYSTDDGTMIDYFNAGKLGALTNNWTIGRINDTRKSMIEVDPNLDFEKAVGIVKLKGKDGKMFNTEYANWWSAMLFNGQMEDAKMDRLMSIIDWMHGEEGTRMDFFGIEGKDYKMQDGKMQLLWEKNENGDLVKPAYKAQFRYMGSLDGEFNMEDPNVPEYVKNLYLNHIKDQTPEAANIRKRDLDLVYFKGKNMTKYVDFAQETFDEILQITISAKGPEDAESKYTKWVESMMPRVQKVLDELNSSL